MSISNEDRRLAAKHGVRWGETHGKTKFSGGSFGRPVSPPGNLHDAIAAGEVHPDVVDELLQMEASRTCSKFRLRMEGNPLLEELGKRNRIGMMDQGTCGQDGSPDLPLLIEWAKEEEPGHKGLCVALLSYLWRDRGLEEDQFLEVAAALGVSEEEAARLRS